jgi:two-component system, NtrC family, sensor kinase
MRLRLYQRFNLYIGGILFLGIVFLVYFDAVSNKRLLKEIGLNEAEKLSRSIYDQLYTSMRLGGGRAEDRAIISRFKKFDGIDEIRLIHGVSLDNQFGVEKDELPIDELDRKILVGSTIGIVERNTDGHWSARYEMPFIIREECKICHNARSGEVSGALSVKISIKRYEGLIAEHNRNFLFWGGGILLLTSLAIIITVNKRLLVPLEALKAGAEVLAEGDLSHRVKISTGDEIEDLVATFNKMADSLTASTAKLKNLGEKHSRLVQMAADAILLKDIEANRFVDANPAATALIGYSPDELFNIRPDDIYPVECRSKYREAFKRWVYDGKGYLYDVVMIRKDGFTLPVDISASVVDLDGKKYVQEIWRDLSERKGFGDTMKRYIAGLEDTVKERTAELNKSLNELKDAYSRLQNSEQRLIQSAKLVSLGEMGAGIAHELNSPLAGILSITEVLLGRLDRKDPNYYLLEKIKDAAVRSKYIILDMMAYARPSRGNFEPVYLNLIIKATVGLFISEIKTLSIEIIEDLDPDLPKVSGNKAQLMEVILNIIKNARDAMGGNGKIFISTRRVIEDGNEFSIVEIRDTGPGIEDGIIDKIFDPFFTTKEKGGGLNIGLGLSIAQSIIKEHGGRIGIEGGMRGGGAVFKIFLPGKT